MTSIVYFLFLVSVINVFDVVMDVVIDIAIDVVVINGFNDGVIVGAVCFSISAYSLCLCFCTTRDVIWHRQKQIFISVCARGLR
jgi:hypothetical protein